MSPPPMRLMTYSLATAQELERCVEAELKHGALFVSSIDPPEPLSPVTVLLRVPGKSRPIEFSATVIHASRPGEPSKTGPGAGLKLSNEEEVLRQIRALQAELSPGGSSSSEETKREPLDAPRSVAARPGPRSRGEPGPSRPRRPTPLPSSPAHPPGNGTGTRPRPATGRSERAADGSPGNGAGARPRPAGRRAEQAPPVPDASPSRPGPGRAFLPRAAPRGPRSEGDSTRPGSRRPERNAEAELPRVETRHSMKMRGVGKAPEPRSRPSRSKPSREPSPNGRGSSAAANLEPRATRASRALEARSGGSNNEPRSRPVKPAPSREPSPNGHGAAAKSSPRPTRASRTLESKSNGGSGRAGARGQARPNKRGNGAASGPPASSSAPSSVARTRASFRQRPGKPAQGQRAPKAENSAQAEAPPSLEEIERQAADFERNLSNAGHYRVLGIARDASDAEIRSAFFGLARRFHPDSYFRRASEESQRTLESVYQRICQAYQVLSSSERRLKYDLTLGTTGRTRDGGDAAARKRFAAELMSKHMRRNPGLSPGAHKLYLRAHKAYEQGDLKGSQQVCQLALRMDPSHEGARELLGAVESALEKP